MNSRSYFLNYLCSKITKTFCFLPKLCYSTSRKMKFSTNDLFSECDQMGNFLMILLHLLKKSLMENFILCAVQKLILFYFILFFFFFFFFWMIEDCFCWVTQRKCYFMLFHPSCISFDEFLQLFDFFRNFLCDCQDQDIMSRSMTIIPQTSWLLVLTLLLHLYKIPRTYLYFWTKCLEQNREIQ